MAAKVAVDCMEPREHSDSRPSGDRIICQSRAPRIQGLPRVQVEDVYNLRGIKDDDIMKASWSCFHGLFQKEGTEWGLATTKVDGINDLCSFLHGGWDRFRVFTATSDLLQLRRG